jgi:hypothetical protein
VLSAAVEQHRTPAVDGGAIRRSRGAVISHLADTQPSSRGDLGAEEDEAEALLALFAAV